MSKLGTSNHCPIYEFSNEGNLIVQKVWITPRISPLYKTVLEKHSLELSIWWSPPDNLNWGQKMALHERRPKSTRWAPNGLTPWVEKVLPNIPEDWELLNISLEHFVLTSSQLPTICIFHPFFFCKMYIFLQFTSLKLCWVLESSVSFRHWASTSSYSW